MASIKNAPRDMSVAGDLLIADGARLEGNLRCEGTARLGQHALIDGHLDVAGSVVAQAHARVTGSVACSGDVDWDTTAVAASMRSGGAFLVGGQRLAASLDAPGGVAPFAAEGERA